MRNIERRRVRREEFLQAGASKVRHCLCQKDGYCLGPSALGNAYLMRHFKQHKSKRKANYAWSAVVAYRNICHLDRYIATTISVDIRKAADKTQIFWKLQLKSIPIWNSQIRHLRTSTCRRAANNWHNKRHHAWIPTLDACFETPIGKYTHFRIIFWVKMADCSKYLCARGAGTYICCAWR